jgi:hypothetical protein
VVGCKCFGNDLGKGEYEIYRSTMVGLFGEKDVGWNRDSDKKIAQSHTLVHHCRAPISVFLP